MKGIGLTRSIYAFSEGHGQYESLSTVQVTLKNNTFYSFYTE